METDSDLTFQDYSLKEYWDKRYSIQKGLSFDWFLSYKDLKGTLLDLLNSKWDSEIIDLGCGNSKICENLYNDGFKYVTCIDFSKVLINDLIQRYADFPELDFQVMDALQLQIDDEAINIIIDKATMDSIICGSSSAQSVMSMLSNVYRVLSSGGYYLCISHGKPETRTPFLLANNFNWKLEIQKIAKPESSLLKQNDEQEYYYIYVCQKL